jgi:glyoxylase-like metal-dependent hydrolase (beta-lactamase superfamily II)
MEDDMKAICLTAVRAVVILGLLAMPGAGRAQDWDKIQVRILPISGSVHMLTGAGGNIGISVGQDGVLLVDSEFAELHDKIVSAIAAIGGGPVRFVLNTNWHYDHVRGNELFRKRGAVIIGHANCPARMAGETYHEILDAKIGPYAPAAWPEVTFADSLAVHLNGEDIEAVHIANAHSDADALYVFRKANVIHTGDLFFSSGYPYIDIGNGGSVDGMIAAADRILAMTNAGTKLIPGHGPLADRQRLQAYRSMLVTVRDRVAALIKQGRSLDQVVAAKPSSDFDSAWSAAMTPQQFVAIVFTDVSRRRH